MRRFVTWSVIARLLAGSFIGLASCRLIDFIVFGGGERFDRTPVGACLTILFAIIWGGTLLFLVPVRLFLDRTRIDDMEKRVVRGEVDPKNMSWLEQHMFYANYGSLPKWLYVPFIFLVWVLVGFIVLCLIAAIVMYVLAHVFKA